VSADVIVVGSGAAGISAALAAAGRGLDVILITKDQNGGATPLAQGGLAAALGPGDDPDQHGSDTLAAGAGLCDPSVVSALASAAPGAIERLVSLGAGLDRVGLRREGGHRRHRIVHSGNDATGAEVHRVLLAALHASPVRVLDRTIALDLVPGGLLATGPAAAQVLEARAVVLAAGGLGQAYATTTNPPGATGDAIALALRAGAVLQDPEFVQFHPTVLHLPADSAGQRPLITEALRGAGATLLTHDGAPLMAGRHPLGDLAPRDVVSAAMAGRLADGDPHLWLDATGLAAGVLESGFPTVTAACRAHGIDPVTDLIPVAPGAHYYCGGIRAGLDGRTSLPACTRWGRRLPPVCTAPTGWPPTPSPKPSSRGLAPGRPWNCPAPERGLFKPRSGRPAWRAVRRSRRRCPGTLAYSAMRMACAPCWGSSATRCPRASGMPRRPACGPSPR